MNDEDLPPAWVYVGMLIFLLGIWQLIELCVWASHHIRIVP